MGIIIILGGLGWRLHDIKHMWGTRKMSVIWKDLCEHILAPVHTIFLFLSKLNLVKVLKSTFPFSKNWDNGLTPGMWCFSHPQWFLIASLRYCLDILFVSWGVVYMDQKVWISFKNVRFSLILSSFTLVSLFLLNSFFILTNWAIHVYWGGFRIHKTLQEESQL